MAKNGGNTVKSVQSPSISKGLVPNKKTPAPKKSFGSTFSAPKKP